MGHMNVRFYVARAAEGLVGLANALGVRGAFRERANSTLLVRDHHIRFLREARSRAPLHMVAGVLEMGECEARFLQLLIHSTTGELAASFQTVVAHVTTFDERPFPWSQATRRLGDDLRISVPERAAPRSLDLAPSAGRANLAEAEALGLIRLATGAISAGDCDAFGRMRADLFIGRVSDGIPGLSAALRAGAGGAAGRSPDSVGGAVLEYRLAYHAWPRAGDRFEIRSGLTDVQDRTLHWTHWMLDPETGGAWGSSQAVAVALDLTARKIIPVSPQDQALLRMRTTPGLTF